jgi:hypothetical protein
MARFQPVSTPEGGQGFLSIVVSAVDFVFSRRAGRNECVTLVLLVTGESGTCAVGLVDTRGYSSSCQGYPVEPNRVDGRTLKNVGIPLGHPRIRLRSTIGD